jgi:hypothetical protein
MRGWGGVAIIGMLVLLGCGRTIPPPEVPPRIAPPGLEQPGPAPGGTGRVLIDVTNGPAAVAQVLGRHQYAAAGGGAVVMGYGMSTRPLCHFTPCWADLEVGDAELHIVHRADPELFDLVPIRVSSRTSMVRHTLGRSEPGGAAYFLGLMGVTLGSSAVAVGVPLWAALDDPSAGMLITITGGVTAVLGILMMILDQPSVQMGSTNQYDLESPAPAAPAEPSTTMTL